MTSTDTLIANNRPLTAAHEDYLKAIYMLNKREPKVTNSLLAKHLKVTPTSATNMVKKLGELDLVEHERYQGMALTAAGERVALEVLRHHRLLELYLHEKLNLSWDQVHIEAEKLEHVISEELEDAIAAALGHPTIDPHGDPIPTKDGYVEQLPGIPLSSAELGNGYQLVRVMIQDKEWLDYLTEIGLSLSSQLNLVERAPFDGPLLIEVGGKNHALSPDVAKLLIVIKSDESEN